VEQARQTGATVRPIHEGDVEAIVQIDALVTGDKRAGFWRGVLAAYLAAEGEQREGLSPDLCQIAELDGRVVGFMVGDIQSWQFGMPRSGRIVTVGVHPEYRRRDVGTGLMDAMLDVFRKFRVHRLHCLVEAGDPLREFFAANGLEETRILTMAMEL
jgi:ribosomal protein S18 acetylase RimI-like enzyme